LLPGFHHSPKFHCQPHLIRRPSTTRCFEINEFYIQNQATPASI